MSEFSNILSINSFLDFIKPSHMVVVSVFIFGLSLIMSVILIFHFNKYRQYSFGTILAEFIYIVGIVLLFFLAIIFLILFSR